MAFGRILSWLICLLGCLGIRIAFPVGSNGALLGSTYGLGWDLNKIIITTFWIRSDICMLSLLVADKIRALM